MEEEIDDLMDDESMDEDMIDESIDNVPVALDRFGRDVFELQWGTIADPNNEFGVLLGLQYRGDEPISYTDAVFELSSPLTLSGTSGVLDGASLIGTFSQPGTFSFTESQETTAEEITFRFEVSTNRSISEFEFANAFAVQYENRDIGGGTLSLNWGNNTPNVTFDLPRYNELENDDGIREVWGGTGIERSDTQYFGQPSLFETFVLPGDGGNYSGELLETGEVRLTVTDSSDPLFGQSYRILDGDELLFGGDPAIRDEVMSLLDFGLIHEMSTDELETVSELTYMYEHTLLSADLLGEISREVVDGDEILDVLIQDRFNIVTSDDSVWDFVDAIVEDALQQGSVSEDDAILILTPMYQELLKRDPDQQGLDFWTNQLTSGNVAIEDISTAFYDGINAPTGGEHDRGHLDFAWNLSATLVFEMGILDQQFAQGVSDRIEPVMTVEERNDLIAELQEYSMEASNGDNINDAFRLNFPDVFDDLGISFGGM